VCAGAANFWQIEAMSIRRFMVMTVCMTVAAFALFYVEFFIFPDARPATIFEQLFTWVWTVFSWPLSVVWLMSPKDPPIIVFIFLWIATGLFWAFVVELFLKLKARRLKRNSI
jgi:phage shock protein PspC (stress-responsive transcriptional regulator)